MADVETFAKYGVHDNVIRLGSALARDTTTTAYPSPTLPR